jgi:anion-transporting  ArsA/GET3 family ATPase
MKGEAPLVIVVGSGGVGKTTVAAALGAESAEQGDDTLVMTFDPSLRLKDTLGVGDAARDQEVEVALDAPGRLSASLLDARRTFDRLVERYAPDETSRRRIVENRFYRDLAGHLAGILEYMAVERLYEVASEGRYERIVLDTPPTRQALDFLEAPQRIVGFLDSGAVRLALRPWFDERGHLRPTRRLGFLGRGLENLLDRVVGLDLLRDMAEFFQAFGPLYDGFRDRAARVREMLQESTTRFVLVSGPGEEKVPDTMFFARKLVETGHDVGRVVVNRVHPPELAREGKAGEPGRRGPQSDDGAELLRWLAEQDARGLAALGSLLGQRTALDVVPLLERAPNDIKGLRAVARSVTPPW